MVINTHKLGHTAFYTPQITSAKYLELRTQAYLKVASHSPVRIFDTLEYPSKGRRIGKARAFLEPMLKQKTLYVRIPPTIEERSVENRLERLEGQFNKLVSNTWSYLFSERDVKEMGKIAKDMLGDSKKMQELAEQLQKTDEES